MVSSQTNLVLNAFIILSVLMLSFAPTAIAIPIASQGLSHHSTNVSPTLQTLASATTTSPASQLINPVVTDSPLTTEEGPSVKRQTANALCGHVQESTIHFLSLSQKLHRAKLMLIQLNSRIIDTCSPSKHRNTMTPTTGADLKVSYNTPTTTPTTSPTGSVAQVNTTNITNGTVGNAAGNRNIALGTAAAVVTEVTEATGFARLSQSDKIALFCGAIGVPGTIATVWTARRLMKQ